MLFTYLRRVSFQFDESGMYCLRRTKWRGFNVTTTSCFYSTSVRTKYKKYYQVLEIPENSDQEQIRTAYLHLVKKYHPDNPNGDLKKFQLIDKAFRALIEMKSKERWNVDEEQASMKEEYDIRHTAPQHRQYLSYGGVGSGTPFQREKQYQKVRAMQAASNVLEHRIAKVIADEKTLMDKSVPLQHKIKTKYGFERLVEDLIQESMSKGEFNNLSGSGKPLKLHQDINPYVDFTTHKLNQVLIDNGFTPEWITLQKEIREEIAQFRAILQRERANFGPQPFNEEDNGDWLQIVSGCRKVVDGVNKKISKYNLVVPMMNKQMMLVDLQRESDKVMISGGFSPSGRVRFKTEESTYRSDGDSLMDVLRLFSFFKK